MARCAVRALTARNSAVNASNEFRPLNAGGDAAARHPYPGEMDLSLNHLNALP